MKSLITLIIKTLFFSLIITLFISLNSCSSSTNEKKKIGIIVPIEHQAMNEIVQAFTQTLSSQSPIPLTFKVANAQGDMNLQRAIISQMKNYDLVVPIGTAATQMTLSMIRDKPIVSLASMYSDEDRKKQNPCHTVLVHDEIAPRQIIDFIHQVYPNINRIALIHSTSDKIFPDIKDAIQRAKQYNINIKPMMVSNLSELYSTANAIPQNTQAILILKDNLIVSGITTLANTAEKRGIPLIASDQGSVQNGAAFALGVYERDIGIEGAKLASLVLSGKPICSLANVQLKKLMVFINTAALTKEQQSLIPIQSAAAKMQYQIETMKGK